METMAPPPCQSRIPASLQAVFLASNRGIDVHQVPSDKAANKTFRFGSIVTPASPTSVTATIVEGSHTVFAESRNQLCLPVALVSPQNYLDALLKQRGYSTE
jgi:hypothetical protein